MLKDCECIGYNNGKCEGGSNANNCNNCCSICEDECSAQCPVVAENIINKTI